MALALVTLSCGLLPCAGGIKPIASSSSRAASLLPCAGGIKSRSAHFKFKGVAPVRGRY